MPDTGDLCPTCKRAVGYDCSCEPWQLADHYEAEVARLTAELDRVNKMLGECFNLGVDYLTATKEAEAERDALRAAQFRQNRLHELNAEALAEIKATVDGKSKQSVKAVIYGLLEEINNITPRDETAV